jgi:hypothetical protein
MVQILFVFAWLCIPGRAIPMSVMVIIYKMIALDAAS